VLFHYKQKLERLLINRLYILRLTSATRNNYQLSLASTSTVQQQGTWPAIPTRQSGFYQTVFVMAPLAAMRQHALQSRSPSPAATYHTTATLDTGRLAALTRHPLSSTCSRGSADPLLWKKP